VKCRQSRPVKKRMNARSGGKGAHLGFEGQRTLLVRVVEGGDETYPTSSSQARSMAFRRHPNGKKGGDLKGAFSIVTKDGDRCGKERWCRRHINSVETLLGRFGRALLITNRRGKKVLDQRTRKKNLSHVGLRATGEVREEKKPRPSIPAWGKHANFTSVTITRLGRWRKCATRSHKNMSRRYYTRRDDASRGRRSRNH